MDWPPRALRRVSSALRLDCGCDHTCSCTLGIKEFTYIDGPFGGGVFYDKQNVIRRDGTTVLQEVSFSGFNDSGKDAAHRVPVQPVPGRIAFTYRSVGRQLVFTGAMRWIPQA